MYALSISLRLRCSLPDTILQAICISFAISSFVVSLLQAELGTLAKVGWADPDWVMMWWLVWYIVVWYR
jgi:hypothetical protein